jgi:hypothetical protein
MRSILDVLYNFHWIAPGEAARAAQAYIGLLGPLLRRHGIRGVINLRGANPGHGWWRYETRICAQNDVVHGDVKLNSRQLPTPRMLVDLLDAFDSLPQPFLLKCSGGQDRTSFAGALYILHTRGWSYTASAEKQFAFWPYLHWPHGQQRWLKLFLPFAREQAAGGVLREWIEKAYSAEEFRDWLEARGESGSFRGLYGVPGSASRR